MMAPAWVTTASTCLYVASPPSPALNTPSSRPASANVMTGAMTIVEPSVMYRIIGSIRSICRLLLVGDGAAPRFRAADLLIEQRLLAHLGAEQRELPPATTITTASIAPSQVGWATMLRNVCPGEKMTPISRAARFFCTASGREALETSLMVTFSWRVNIAGGQFLAYCQRSCQLYVEVGSDVSFGAINHRLRSPTFIDRTRIQYPHMPRPQSVRLSLLLACTLPLLSFSPRVAAAQGFEPVGARAQGMGGAFVAVADDATATYWNPAGIATIPIFDASLTFGGLEQSSYDRSSEGTPRPAWRSRNASVAGALPVVGVSYYRLRTSRAEPAPTGSDTSVRDDANTAVAGEGSSTWNLGITLVQSIGDAVVVGTTLRMVRAGAEGAALAAVDADGALDTVDDLNITSETKFDADLGVMAYIGRARVGLTVRNLAAPTWDAGSLALESDRLVRVGIGWGPEPTHGRRRGRSHQTRISRRPAPSTEIAALLLSARNAGFGMAALPYAAVPVRRRLASARPVATGGASVGIRSGLLLEGQLTAGGDTVERGWGLGARVTF